MPSLMERRVARSRNIRYEDRQMPQAIADFYLLETLGNVKGCAASQAQLKRLECELAGEFASYLDIALGGELRYAPSHLGDGIPKELSAYFREVDDCGLDRGAAWLIWGVIRRKFGITAVELAEMTFDTPGWEGAYGGAAWASIARVLKSYLQGRMNSRIFVDRCFSMEHNSGSIFNKLWQTSDVPTVLDAHGRDDYGTLLRFASPSAKLAWRRYEWKKRSQFDPIWLGVQQTDSYDELWPEGDAHERH